MSYFKKIRHPELFQGKYKTKNYFEGWYYKLVTKDLKTSVAFIPGVSVNEKDPHTFLQVFISTKDHLVAHYVRYQHDEFIYDDKSFMISIGVQLFTYNVVDVHIENPEVSIKGKIDILDILPIKKNVCSPNIMGPFAYIPFMECNHGILSMQSNLSGDLTINNETIDFTGGKAYIEKDWGKSFPESYIWLQSNHFKDDSTSFMFSYAKIPFIGLSFKGLIVNLVYNQKEYRFSTYNFTKIIKKEIKPNEIYFILKKGRYKLHVTAKKDREIELKSPSLGMMSKTIKEGLSGEIHLKLYRSKTLIYEDSGSNSGIEIMMK